MNPWPPERAGARATTTSGRTHDHRPGQPGRHRTRPEATATAPDHEAAATAPDHPAATAGGEGPLARLLETRGGTAAPEAPFVIEHREALIYMLCEAAELEHGIMCQYLFAAFSLKESEDEGLTPDELAAVTRWQRQILSVAAGEMLHLALVHNLLSAIGMAPHLSRPNLPAPAGHYPAGVQLALLPFGDQALRHFMYLERPEGMDLQDAEGLAAMQTAMPSVSPRDIVPTAPGLRHGRAPVPLDRGRLPAPDREVRRGLAVHRPAPRAGHPGAVRLAEPAAGHRAGQRLRGGRGNRGAGRGPAGALARRALRPVRRDPGRVPADAGGQPRDSSRPGR